MLRLYVKKINVCVLHNTLFLTTTLPVLNVSKDLFLTTTFSVLNIRNVETFLVLFKTQFLHAVLPRVLTYQRCNQKP